MVVDDVLEHLPLLLLGLQAQQGPGVALGEPVLAQPVQQPGRELQQPQLIGHRRLGFADAPGGLILGQVIGVDQPVQRHGLLQKIQVPALEVLHQGQQRGAHAVHVDDNAGNLAEPGHPGCPQTALAGDQLKAPVHLPDGQRLEDAVLPDAGRQFLQAVGGKALPRLVGIGVQNVRVKVDDTARLIQALST